MADDIVTRLRAYNIGNIAHEASSHMEETLYEAVDEIERLRADRDRWRKIADDLYKQLAVSFCWHCGHEATRCIDADRAADNYRQAVCGE